MEAKLKQLRTEAEEALRTAPSAADLEALRVRFLGKKGELTAILKQMGTLSAEERPVIGALGNEVRGAIEETISRRSEELRHLELAETLKTEALDVTLPGKRPPYGHKHPMTFLLDEVIDIFVGMGFEVAEGPEVELVRYNFDALNTPASHPARDTQDTFYIGDDVLLRTQTSPMQVRVMEKKKPPIRILSPGRVYRKDEVDATHSPMFHQLEGLVVDRGITMADLKGTLEELVAKIYGPETKTRFRPHHFPFTEPSAELDYMCGFCGGEGCSVCKGEGWIELLGCGMVHPNVLSGCGIDPDVYSGFAFGVGTDRMTMRRFGVTDLRLFFENDVRFLHQF
ncbi:phenylalanine--tRNA ligase subunit alpha [Oscillospiraceae bacterium OttesenSCG-928-G22]|nr:phenylalanine--tRNA ligase subunit alpha [Oscillospiraceae bacterium OttesenSCG-928-G22]